jgi:hypothetical protein
MIYNEKTGKISDIQTDCYGGSSYVIRERKCEVPFSQLEKY